MLKGTVLREVFLPNLNFTPQFCMFLFPSMLLSLLRKYLYFYKQYFNNTAIFHHISGNLVMYIRVCIIAYFVYLITVHSTGTSISYPD